MEGTIPAAPVNFGLIVEAESNCNALMDFDGSGPPDTLQHRVLAFIETVRPMAQVFPKLIGAAKAAVDMQTRIKRLEATLRVIQKLAADRKRGVSTLDDMLEHEQRCQFIQQEASAAILGAEKPINVMTIIGGDRAYLNVPLDEAQARYLKETGVEPLPSMIQSFRFVDQITIERT